MTRVPLSNTGDWKLEYEEQDVRGFDALDAAGNRIGEVEHMIVNTDTKYVDAVVLDDGTEYPARDIRIGDGVIYVEGEHPEDVAETVTVYDDYGRVKEREMVVGDRDKFDTYGDDFRSHYETTYGEAGQAYDYYEPAYRYGYDAAYQEPYRNRLYDDVETDLQNDYSGRHPNTAYDEVRDAVRYGYTRAQRGRRD
ncbi:MAG: PRC-barrel domain-containing protein [Rhodothermales bacterium]|nr:PRC-barrel domain-containing protein [Rhodothermales bacterium]